MAEKSKPTPASESSDLDWTDDVTKLHRLLAGKIHVDNDGSRLPVTVRGCGAPSVDTAYLLIEGVSSLLAAGSDPVSLDKLKPLIAASLLIQYAEKCIPGVMAWACATMYNPRGGFRPGDIIVWSGHFSKEHAESWLPMWRKYLDDPNEQYYIFQPVSLRECSLHDMVKPEAAFDRSRR